jgi:hypothetical protein
MFENGGLLSLPGSDSATTMLKVGLGPGFLSQLLCALGRRGVVFSSGLNWQQR